MKEYYTFKDVLYERPSIQKKCYSYCYLLNHGQSITMHINMMIFIFDLLNIVYMLSQKYLFSFYFYFFGKQFRVWLRGNQFYNQFMLKKLHYVINIKIKKLSSTIYILCVIRLNLLSKFIYLLLVKSAVRKEGRTKEINKKKLNVISDTLHDRI